MFLSVLGSSPMGARLEKCTRSPQYSNGAFRNSEPTPQLVPAMSWWKVLAMTLSNSTESRPRVVIPHVMTDLHAVRSDAWDIVWFGHSSYLISNGTFRILVDPVFGGYASPVSLFGKAFNGANSYQPEHMPDIDVLLITHDHYDHLCMKTVRALLPRTRRIVTSLGVGAHLERWGVDPSMITELDWWESAALATGTELTAAPARHFSGRAFRRGATLWSSFILATPECTLYLGADSGYGAHFSEIGKRCNGFDLALLEAGQYGANWPHIHMLPEETVKAAHDLGASVLMPVHWAKFALSYHPWNEPVERVLAAARTSGLHVTTPRIGERVIVREHYPLSEWWRSS